jgi:hypothetical protein
VNSSLKNEQLEEANTVVLREGCQGLAKEALKRVPRQDRKNFAVLAKTLRSVFLFKEEEVDDNAILNRMMNLKQGSKKLDDYIEEGLRLKPMVKLEF